MSEEKNIVELYGKDFLKKYKIKKKVCNLEKPFAFISYAHDQHDMSIVFRIFNILFDKGYNLWIDVANIPKGAAPWTRAADLAIQNPNCKVALFFRSENSLVRGPIKEELGNLFVKIGMDNITVIDIWKEENVNADILKNTLYQKGEDVTHIREINEKYVHPNCNAIRFGEDCENNIDDLIEEIIEELEDREIIKSETNSNQQEVEKEEKEMNLGDSILSNDKSSFERFPNTVNDFSVEKTLNATDVKYKICTFGKGLDIGQDILVDVVFNGKRYEAKSHSTSPGRIDRLSGFYKDNHFEEGDRIKATYSAEENTIYIEKI